jgi:hypothetical protein
MVRNLLSIVARRALGIHFEIVLKWTDESKGAPGQK